MCDTIKHTPVLEPTVIVMFNESHVVTVMDMMKALPKVLLHAK